MTDVDPETAAIIRAWAVCDGGVQAQCADDAKQANDAETFSAADAYTIGLWQDTLNAVDRLAPFADQAIRSKRWKMSAAENDADELFRAAATEARRVTRDITRDDADDLFDAALDDLPKPTEGEQ